MWKLGFLLLGLFCLFPASESQSLCPDLWASFSNYSTVICYWPPRRNQQLSFHEASKRCESMSQNYTARLVTIEDIFQYNFLRTRYSQFAQVSKLFNTAKIWVGANTTNTANPMDNFRWITNNRNLLRTSSWWLNGEPNNFPGANNRIIEGCVILGTINGQVGLIDTPCGSTATFMCQYSVPISCPSRQYWNTTFNRCTDYNRGFLEPCVNNDQCNSGAGLTCQSGQCRCGNSPRLFWAYETGKCIYCNTAWRRYNEIGAVNKSYCYKMPINDNTTDLNFHQAKAACESSSSRLLEINNEAEFARTVGFIGTFARNNPSLRVWVGANTTSTSFSRWNYRWLTTQTLLSYSAPLWCTNEPNNFPPSNTTINEGCIFMWFRNNAVCLNDYYCNLPAQYTCEYVG